MWQQALQNLRLVLSSVLQAIFHVSRSTRALVDRKRWWPTNKELTSSCMRRIRALEHVPLGLEGHHTRKQWLLRLDPQCPYPSNSDQRYRSWKGQRRREAMTHFEVHTKDPKNYKNVVNSFLNIFGFSYFTSYLSLYTSPLLQLFSTKMKDGTINSESSMQCS